MKKVVFRTPPKGMLAITLLVLGLLVFVWLHWRGQRQTAMFVFMVLTALAMTLYTLRGELGLSPERRELYGKRFWLGFTTRKVVVRLGSDDVLYLTEDFTSTRNGISVWHHLEASGQLIAPAGATTAPYILASQAWEPGQIRLENFAREAAELLGVTLEDSRKYTEALERYR